MTDAELKATAAAVRGWARDAASAFHGVGWDSSMAGGITYSEGFDSVLALCDAVERLTAERDAALQRLSRAPTADVGRMMRERWGAGHAPGTPCVPFWLYPFAREVVIQTRAAELVHDPSLTAEQGGPPHGDVLIEQAWHHCELEGCLPIPPRGEEG